MNYQRVYDIHLLDDLHNYFPAVLYEPDRFHSVVQLLSYVRTQTRSHFDIFSRESRNHMNTVSPPSVAPASRRPPSAAGTMRHVHPPPIPIAVPRAAVPRPIPIPEYVTWGGEPVQEALRAVFPLIPQNLESVVVAPSAEQIAAATVIQTVTAENEMCPICQDSVAVGANVRHLTACGHRFHTGCIDTWFTRNVHCPVCRHDIRETDPAPTATATTR